MFWQLVANGLVTGSVIAIAAVGVSLVYGIASVRLSEPQLITIVGAAVPICAVGVFLSRSTLGRTMRALADDRALAAIAGIHVGRVITYTWIISGLLAGLAGVFAGLVQS